MTREQIIEQLESLIYSQGGAEALYQRILEGGKLRKTDPEPDYRLLIRRSLLGDLILHLNQERLVSVKNPDGHYDCQQPEHDERQLAFGWE